MKTRVIAIAVLVTVLAVPAALHAQETDPLSVVTAWNDAMNASNVEAALAFLADDAFITLIPPPIEGHEGVFRGKEEIRAWWEGLYAQNGASTLSNCQVDGETVTCIVNYRDDGLRGIGVDSIDNEFVVIVQGGKIQTYTATVTPESLEKLQAAMAALELPEAGVGPPPARTLPLWLGVGGILLLAVGLGMGLRRASGRAK